MGHHVLARLRGGILAGSWSRDGRHLVADGSNRPNCKNDVAVKGTASSRNNGLSRAAAAVVRTTSEPVASTGSGTVRPNS